MKLDATVMPRHKKLPSRRTFPAWVLPQPSEEFFVRFYLPTGREVWWPATVKDIIEYNIDDEILTEVSVLYHAAHGYEVERASV